MAPDERWYEFVEHATFTRPVYVKASSRAEARQRIAQAVPDYPPSFPDLRFDLRGRVAPDQGYVDSLAAEQREQ